LIANFSGTGRQALQGVTPDVNGTFIFRVSLPRTFTGRTSWVLLIPGPGESAVNAASWISSPGFPLRPMPSKVSYAAVANLSDGQVVVSLTPGTGAVRMLPSPSTCRVVVVPPPTYALGCDSFRRISIPTKTAIRCDWHNSGNGSTSGYAVVTMTNSSLQGFGELVFGLDINVPPETPSNNFFEVTLRLPDNTTVDANVFVPGVRVFAPQLRSSVRWQVRCEAIEWLTAWIGHAQAARVFRNTLAQSLQVPSASITVEHVTALRHAPPFPRSLQETRLLTSQHVLLFLEVNYSVAVLLHSPNTREELMARLQSNTFNSTLDASFRQVASAAGLTPLTTEGTDVLRPTVEEPPRVSQPFIAWTQPNNAGDVTRVSLGMTFSRSTSMVLALLILLPHGFQHQLEGLGSFQHVRDGGGIPFPVASDELSYIDTWNTSILRVLVSKTKPVTPGKYTFTLPVLIPSTVPARNVWQLCVCSSRECDRVEHWSVTASFALPGFNLGEPMRRRAIAEAMRMALASRWLIFIITAALSLAFP